MNNKLTLLLLVTLALSIKSYSQDYDFRKAKWGESMEEVKKNESVELEVRDLSFGGAKMLAGLVRVMGLDALVAYIFIDDQLHKATYVFNTTEFDGKDCIEHYNSIKDVLVAKYGKPRGKSDMIWKDDLYKDDEHLWGSALSLGHLEYNSIWDDPLIALTLEGDFREIDLAVEYLSPEFIKKMEALKANSIEF